MEIVTTFVAAAGEMGEEGVLTSLMRNIPPVPTYVPKILYSTKLRDLRQRRWLSDEQPFLAFTYINPQLSGALFSRLNVTFSMVPIIAAGSRFQLDPIIQQSWYRLEYGLTNLYQTLCPDIMALQNIIFDFYFIPSECGYLRIHDEEVAARRCAIRSRDAIIHLTAIVSFAIAINLHEGEVGQPGAHWVKRMISLGVHAQWLDELQKSFVCDFRPGVRLGAFVHIGDTRWADKIPRFIQAGVPLWFWWGTTQSLYEKRKPVCKLAILEKFLPSLPHTRPRRGWFSSKASTSAVPPPGLSSHSLIHASPISSPLSPLAVSRAPVLLPSNSRQMEGETWKDFFRRADQLVVSYMEHESPPEKQRREVLESAVRAGHPPTARALVYVWVDVGGFLVRKQIDHHDRLHVWQSFPASQRRFNSIWEEWDLCHELDPHICRDPIQGPITLYGEESPQNMDMGTDDEPFPAQSGIGSGPKLQQTGDLDFYEEDLKTMYSNAILSPERATLPIEDVLLERFGLHLKNASLFSDVYVNRASRWCSEDWTLISRAIGCHAWHLSEVEIASIIDLFNMIITNHASPKLSPSMSDLVVGNSHHLAKVLHLCAIRRLFKGRHPAVTWYVVEESATDAGQHKPWLFSLQSASSVLQAIRWAKGYGKSIPDICRRFVELGIPFNTVMPINVYPPPLPAELSLHGLGWRPKDYKPDTLDYAAYERVRDEFLRGPFGRAALMSGGILWRLAIDAVPTLDVLAGPSQEVNRYGSIIFSENNIDYVDDALSESAMALICGVYHVQKGEAPLEHCGPC